MSDLSESVRIVINIIADITMLITATNPMSLVLVALNLTLLLISAFTGILNSGNSNSSDTDGSNAVNNSGGISGSYNARTSSDPNRKNGSGIISGNSAAKNSDGTSGNSNTRSIGGASEDSRATKSHGNGGNGSNTVKDNGNKIGNKKNLTGIKGRSHINTTTRMKSQTKKTSTSPVKTDITHSIVPENVVSTEETNTVEGNTAKCEVETLALEAVQLNEKSEKQVSDILNQDEWLLSEIITCLTTATTINNKIQATMNSLQQMAANHMRREIHSLAEVTLPKVILTSLQLYQSLDLLHKYSGDINGHIKQKCQEIQKDLIQVLDKLSESDQLRKMWKLSKRNELADDYDIPEDGQISELNYQASDQSRQTDLDNIKQLMQGFEDSKFEQGKIISNPALHRLGIRLDNALRNYENDSTLPMDDDNENISKSSNDDSLIPVTIRSTGVNRDVILVIDDHEKRDDDKTKNPSASKIRIKSPDVIHVEHSDKTSGKNNINEKEKSSQTTISRKQLQNLQKLSEDMYSSLFNSVNKYDIGKISENCDPEQLPATKLDKPRYALLARLTRNIQRMLITRLRSAFKEYYTKQQQLQIDHCEQTLSNDDLQFEFVFCVDNSGSMSGKKIREALNTLVILMETFHRLEWKFAVVRFGAEQKILKSLGYESMYETLSTPSNTATNASLQDKLLARGQYILESFTTDEKTLPATALKQIAENKELFGNKIKPNVKRFIIMITDGISSQTDTELFTKELAKAHADLYIVCIIPELPKPDDSKFSPQYKQFAIEHEKKAKEFIQRIAPDRNQLIEIGQLDTLTKTVVDDLFHIIEQSILDYASRDRNNQTARRTQFHPLTAFTVRTVRNVELWAHPEIVFSGRSYVSDFRRKIERQAVQQQIDVDLSTSSNEFLDKFDQTMETLEKSYANLELNDVILTHTDKILLQIEQQLEIYISELVRTMEDYIFPSYKPTQSLPDTRGNRLHIPGIVKFICTQGQYNRIYSNQIGSQKPEYRIALLLDQSVSMTGPTYFTSVDMLLALCAALNQIGIEDFNVLTFGKHIELIKSYKQNYDRLFLHHLLNALKIDGETTLLTDAIFAATELLQQQSAHNNNHGPMFIFVLTDGYDNRSSFIQRVIAYAEQRSITVVGMGIGFESNGVCLAFNDWIVAQNPRLLCDALVNWSNEQGDEQTPYDLYHADNISTIKGENNRAYSSTEDVWNEEMKTHFDAVTQNAKRTIDLTFSSTVHNSPLIVEICFVMDCTGSMGSWIQACKQHIKSIADGIKKEMKEKFDKESVLRMAFVAYRDYNDANRYDYIDFHQTPNLQPVEAKIASQQATGGADECEDVQGGLNKALELSWTKDSTARAAQLLVWVGDAPGHTPFCSGGTAGDSYPGGLPDVPLMETLIHEIKDRGLFLLLSDFTSNVQAMLKNIEAIYKRENKESLVKRIKLNQADTSSLLKEVMQQVNTIIASEFM